MTVQQKTKQAIKQGLPLKASAKRRADNSRNKEDDKCGECVGKEANILTKVRTIETCDQGTRCLTFNKTESRGYSRGRMSQISCARISIMAFLLCLFSTTLVSAFPTGMDIFLDIDESPTMNSRVGLEEIPTRQYSQKDMELSAKEFLKKFGYVRPAKWIEVPPLTFEELDYDAYLEEGEPSGEKEDDALGSGDEKSESGEFEVVTWPTESISEEQYQEALIEYQTTNGLNATGQLDNDTASHMGKPRCGVPDIYAITKSHKTDDFPISNTEISPLDVGHEATSQSHYDEINDPQNTTSSVDVTPTAASVLTGGNHNRSLPRQKRSFEVEYEHIRISKREDIPSQITEAPLPDRSRMVWESRASRNKRSVTYMEKSGWLKPFSKKVITWRLVQEWQTKRSIHPTEIWLTIKLAFRMWSEIIPRNFREDITSPITQVDILIGFGTRLHNRCRVPFKDGAITKEYAHAWPLPRAEIHFNDDQPFVSVSWDAVRNSHAYNRVHGHRIPISLLKVAVHEIGHTLGLPHIRRENSVMSPVYVPSHDTGIKEIGVEDKRDIQNLYGPCEGNFDAVFDWVRPYTANDGTHKLRFNTFFFKKTWYWLYSNGGRRPRYGDPRYTSDTFKGVLDGYSRYSYGKINGIVHIRDSFIEFDSDNEIAMTTDSYGRRYPRRIADGFPGIPSPIDTVFYHLDERILYFFKGNWVYKFDWIQHKVVWADYIYRVFPGWGGATPLPSNIDAAYYSYTHKAYFFFKGPYFWKLADERDRTNNPGVFIPDNAVGPRGRIASRWEYICDVDETEIKLSPTG